MSLVAMAEGHQLMSRNDEADAFTLVNIASPSDIRSRDNKRLIRANATAHAHSKRRQAASTNGSSQLSNKDGGSSAARSSARPRQSRPYTVHKTRLDPWATAKTALAHPKSADTEPVDARPQAIKTSPSTKIPRLDPQYHFLTWCDPAEANSSRQRRQIRSHVAKTSHPSVRAQAAAATQVEESPLAAPELEHAASTGGSTDEEVDPKPNVIEVSQPHLLTSPCLGIHRTTYVDVIARSDRAFSQLITCNNAQHVGRIVQNSGCDIHLVMDHYLFILFSQLYSLQTRAGLKPQSDQRTTYFTNFVLSDPALFLSVILLGVAHKLGHAGKKTHRTEILRLQMAVVGAINYALNDHKRATSDAVIYGVANLACYDAIWGEPDEYAMHMTGLKQMVTLRGGLHELGLAGILQISLLWSDANCAHLLRTTPFFAEHDLPDPDVESFCSGLLKGELHRNW